MRPNYQAGALLSARDLNDEQFYRIQRLRRHDRFAHGTGVVCGLGVFAVPSRGRPWELVVCPGYAVGPCGDEIEVPVRVFVNLRDSHWSRLYSNGVAARVAFLGLRYMGAEGVATAAGGGDCGCGCSSHAGESGARHRDGYAIEVVWTFHPESTRFDLCSGVPSPCPSAGQGPYVILAAVRLPASENTPLTNHDIIQV